MLKMRRLFNGLISLCLLLMLLALPLPVMRVIISARRGRRAPEVARHTSSRGRRPAIGMPRADFAPTAQTQEGNHMCSHHC